MERDLPINATSTRGGISIHALRMERDATELTLAITETISIHALRMERDRPRRSPEIP